MSESAKFDDKAIKAMEDAMKIMVACLPASWIDPGFKGVMSNKAKKLQEAIAKNLLRWSKE